MEWEQQDSGITAEAELYGVDADGGRLLAVGYADADLLVLTSPDGESWTTRSAGVSGDYLADATFGEGLYVIAGQATQPLLLTSPDTVTWTQRTIPRSAEEFDLVNAVAYGNGTFVMVGRGSSPGGQLAWSSADGITWVTRLSGLASSGDLNDVQYGADKFVAVGNYGTDRNQIFTSSDGTSWTERFIGDAGSGQVLGIAYGQGKYVAVGGAGSDLPLILTSSDGVSWTQQDASISDGGQLWSVTYGDGRFVAVGQLFSSPSDGLILTSEDGETWSRDETGVTPADDCTLYKVTFLDDRFVAVGSVYEDSAYKTLILASSAAADGWGMVLS